MCDDDDFDGDYDDEDDEDGDESAIAGLDDTIAYETEHSSAGEDREATALDLDMSAVLGHSFLDQSTGAPSSRSFANSRRILLESEGEEQQQQQQQQQQGEVAVVEGEVEEEVEVEEEPDKSDGIDLGSSIGECSDESVSGVPVNTLGGGGRRRRGGRRRESSSPLSTERRYRHRRQVLLDSDEEGSDSESDSEMKLHRSVWRGNDGPCGEEEEEEEKEEIANQCSLSCLDREPSQNDDSLQFSPCQGTLTSLACVVVSVCARLTERESIRLCLVLVVVLVLVFVCLVVCLSLHLFFFVRLSFCLSLLFLCSLLSALSLSLLWSLTSCPCLVPRVSVSLTLMSGCICTRSSVFSLLSALCSLLSAFDPLHSHLESCSSAKNESSTTRELFGTEGIRKNSRAQTE
jgi:hypothetical protein